MGWIGKVPAVAKAGYDIGGSLWPLAAGAAGAIGGALSTAWDSRYRGDGSRIITEMYGRRPGYRRTTGYRRYGSRTMTQVARQRRRRRIPGRLRGIVRTGGAWGRARRITPELKNYDSAIAIPASATFTVPNTNTLGGVLLGLQQGTAPTQRIGRKINAKRLQFIGIAIFDPTAVTAGQDSDVMHIYCVLDKQTNGSTFTMADLFSNPNPGLQLRNLDTSARFRILHHETVHFEAAASSATIWAGQQRQVEFTVDLKSMPIEMSSTNGSNAEFKENNIYIFMGSTSGVSNLVGSARVRYYDC